MSVQELAAKTATEIRSRGWFTGSMACHSEGFAWAGPPDEPTDDHVCKVCVVGGIATVSTGDPWGFTVKHDDGGSTWVLPDDEDVVGLFEALKTEAGADYDYGELIRSVTYWNDDSKHRYVEGEAVGLDGAVVLAALDKIAAS